MRLLSTGGRARRFSDVPLAVVCGLASLGLLVAASLTVSGDPAAVGFPQPGGPAWWCTAVVLVVQAACLVRVRRFPFAGLTAVGGAPLVLVLAFPNGTASLSALAVVVALYLVVSANAFRPLWLVLVHVGALAAVTQFVNEFRLSSGSVPVALGGAVLQGLVVVALGALPGTAVAAQRDAGEARQRELLAQRREREALLKAEVEHQRVAMSRELHDLAAHHMSGIALVAGTIARQIDSDPVAAKGLALHVREQSSGVLNDLRRLVGLLREDADGAPTIESLAAVPDLVAARRATGMRIDLVVSTEPENAGVGPLAQLVGYRVVQEALSNAAVHAPGASCVVELGPRHDDRFTVVVRNTSGRGPDPGPGGGFGLVGMAERAQLVGAGIQYGATADGGWEVRLALPAGDAVRTAPQPVQEESG
ncbi:sensor histidine kinase [Lentzea sp. NPDC058436]|uniref:sensor histidine kinase n=1 Tax=Lentzea sp. NPDC058436 TaxID=3346499 RepID=UPI00364C9F95